MNKFLKTTSILLLWGLLPAAVGLATPVKKISTHTLSAHLSINSDAFTNSYVRGYSLPNENHFNGLQDVSLAENGVLTIKELLASEQNMEEWKENIRQNDGKIFYWVHPLFMENNLERYYNGVWFTEIYRKLSANKLGLSEDQISRNIVMAEYRHFLSHITAYVKKYHGPVFVAVGSSYLGQVRDFLSVHKIKAVLIPTADLNPEPKGLDELNLDIGDAYGYEDWRYLYMILREKLGVRDIELSGEMCQEQNQHSKNGCVIGTKIGFANAVKLNRTSEQFDVEINHNYVFPDSLYYLDTEIGSTGFSVFKTISQVESSI